MKLRGMIFRFSGGQKHLGAFSFAFARFSLSI